MEVPPLQVLGRDVVLRSAGMLPALHPGCRSAHVVALRLTTRLPLPWAVGFLPYRGDRVAKFDGLPLSVRLSCEVYCGIPILHWTSSAPPEQLLTHITAVIVA